MLRLACIASLILLSLTVQAAKPERWFEVEVYVFKRNIDTIEQWSDKMIPVKLRGNVDLISPIVETEHEITPAITCHQQDLSYFYHSQLSDDQIGSSLMNDCIEQQAVTEHRYPVQIPLNIAALEAPIVYQGDAPTLLDLPQNQFADIIKKVSAQPDIESLLHLTWQQAMLPQRRSKAVHLFAGKDFSSEYQQDGLPIVTKSELTETENTAVNANDTTNKSVNLRSSEATERSAIITNEESPAPPIWQLDGKLNIYLQHYLYIQTDLRLREVGALPKADMNDDQNPSFNVASSPLTDTQQPQSEQAAQPFLYSIPLIQNRRVRSNEIHYFDHPKMGMIIQIRKMPQPEIKPIEQQQ
ncbi:MAG: peptidoglycan binding protein CsiV [Parashewanella sp.]